MKKSFIIQFLSIALLTCFNVNAQVVIGEDATNGLNIEDGAIFQLNSEDKGLMIPNVALSSRNDVSTVSSPVEGLWVYNTANSGSGLDSVSPGFYFWDGSRWQKIFNDGYTIQYEQTETLRVPDYATYDIPGLNQSFTAPYTGVYEIHVTGYIASPNHSDTSQEATVHGSYMLTIDGTTVGESNVSSNTKLTPSAFQALGRQTTIVHLVTLTAGTTYNIAVRARVWDDINVDPSSLNISSICGGAASGLAFFGVCSGPYDGNDISSIDNAQDAYLTITLLQQL